MHTTYMNGNRAHVASVVCFDLHLSLARSLALSVFILSHKIHLNFAFESEHIILFAILKGFECFYSFDL